MPEVLGPSVSQVRVRYAETDQMGVVYHANYLVWFEVGRTDWLRHRGLTYKAMEAEGYLLPVVEAHCAYRSPARYDDVLDVRTMARLASPMRIAFDYEILRAADDRLLTTGHTMHAVLNTEGRPVPVPDHVKDMLR